MGIFGSEASDIRSCCEEESKILECLRKKGQHPISPSDIIIYVTMSELLCFSILQIMEALPPSFSSWIPNIHLEFFQSYYQ